MLTVLWLKRGRVNAACPMFQEGNKESECEGKLIMSTADTVGLTLQTTIKHKRQTKFMPVEKSCNRKQSKAEYLCDR